MRKEKLGKFMLGFSCLLMVVVILNGQEIRIEKKDGITIVQRT
jgi:hypothetical protein